MAPVDGVVRVDGKPLSRGIVTFTPKAGRSASGVIESDGSFRLSTNAAGDGALIGIHGVSVIASAAAPGRPNFDADRPAITKDSTIPSWYASPDTSGLTFEVKAGGANRAELELVSK